MTRDPLSLISIDAETNGLGGKAFMVALLWTNARGEEVVIKMWRCPIVPDRELHPDTRDGVSPWVVEHVLPAVAGYPETNASYEDMVAEVHAFWMLGAVHRVLGRHEAILVGHVNWPVEARLLLDVFAGPERPVYSLSMRELGVTERRVEQGPFPMYDVSSMLLAAGHPEPRSVDSYLFDHGLDAKARMVDAGLPAQEAVPHHPLYDCFAVDLATRSLLDLPQVPPGRFSRAPVEERR